MATEPSVWLTPESPASQSVQTGKGIWYVFVPLWVICCLAGATLAIVTGQVFLGALVISVPTLIGVMGSPNFALCCIALMLPLGGALTYGGYFTGDRAVGAVAALGILAHCLVNGQGIRLRGSPMLPLFLLSAWGVFSIAWAREPIEAAVQAAALVQLCFWGVAIWNGLAYGRSPIWPFRCFVIGMVGALAQAYMTGTFQRMMHTGERLTLISTTGDETINPNTFAALLGLAFIVSIYLVLRDPTKWLRLGWIGCGLVFPGVMLLSGSRGALLALGIAVGASILKVRSLLRSKAMFIGVPLALAILAGGAWWTLSSGYVNKKTMTRMTSSKEVSEAYSERLGLIRVGVSAVAARPFLGTGLGNYLHIVSDVKQVPHADLFNLGAELGVFAMLLYLWYLWKLAKASFKTATVQEKWLVQTVLLFVVICSLKGANYSSKFFWFFTIAVAAISYQTRQAAPVELSATPGPR
jgi:hypothetical protein